MSDKQGKDRKMVEKKKEDPIKKLEKEFQEFQKEWKQFLTNEFHHLVVNVGTLTTNVDTLITQNGKEHNGIQQSIVTMNKCMDAMNEGILTLIKRER